jgi:hypothetical protein
MFLPCEDNLLRNMTLDRPARCVGRHEGLPHDIEGSMVEVLELELELMRR